MFAQPPEPTPSFAIPPIPTNIESVPLPAEQPTNDNIFADRGTAKDLDVTSIVTSRLNALRKLQENPLDSEAIKLMYKTQKDVRYKMINSFYLYFSFLSFQIICNILLCLFFTDVCLGKFEICPWSIYWQYRC